MAATRRLPCCHGWPCLTSSFGAQATMRVIITNILAAVCLVGCDAGPSSMVDRFGTFPAPDPGRQVVVTRREKSLVYFKVVSTTTGKELVADYIGSDAMRWLLYWETPSRLWGYASDIGYFRVFDFRPDGTVAQTEVTATMTIPQVVWSNLPSSLQKQYKAEPDGAANRSQPIRAETNRTSAAAGSDR